jgi:hypothetical protein
MRVLGVEIAQMIVDEMAEPGYSSIVLPRRSTMFIQTIFKSNIIATRTVSAGNTGTQIQVDIYTKATFPRLPGLFEATLRMRRLFEDRTSAANLRHSDNWINKIDRERVDSAYWNDERNEWAVVSETRTFLFQPPFNLEEFYQHLELVLTPSTTTRPAAVPGSPDRTLTPDTLIGIVRTAAVAVSPAGTPRIIERFKAELRGYLTAGG